MALNMHIPACASRVGKSAKMASASVSISEESPSCPLPLALRLANEFPSHVVQVLFKLTFVLDPGTSETVADLLKGEF